MVGLSHVVEAVVAVQDVPGAVDFHSTALDLIVLSRGADGSVTMGAPPGNTGRVRFVPVDPEVHETWDPRPWDIGPRLLGMYSASLPATVARIRAAGGSSCEPVSYPYGTAELSEIVARAPGGLYWTMPQLPAVRQPSPTLDAEPGRAHGELHTAVLVVDDHDAAVDFFLAGGLSVLFDGEMRGEQFERLVGMPAGGALRLAFLIGPERTPGRLEIMSFTEVGEQRDLTRTGHGLRRLLFAATDPESTLAALLAAGGHETPEGTVIGPAGIELAIVGPADSAMPSTPARAADTCPKGQG